MDYNIYIHSPFGQGNDFSQTKPWTTASAAGSQTSAQDTGISSSVNTAFGTMSKFSNPDSLVGMGITALTKVAPWIAAAAVVVSVTDKVITHAIDFGTMQTGNYKAQIEYSNFKQTMSNMLRPFSSSFNYFRNEEQIRIQNQRRMMQRELLGDSIINSYTNRGV